MTTARSKINSTWFAPDGFSSERERDQDPQVCSSRLPLGRNRSRVIPSENYSINIATTTLHSPVPAGGRARLGVTDGVAVSCFHCPRQVQITP